MQSSDSGNQFVLLSILAEPLQCEHLVGLRRACEIAGERLLPLFTRHRITCIWGLRTVEMLAWAKNIKSKQPEHEIALVGGKEWGARFPNREQLAERLLPWMAQSQREGLAVETLLWRNLSWDASHETLLHEAGVTTIVQRWPSGGASYQSHSLHLDRDSRCMTITPAQLTVQTSVHFQEAESPEPFSAEHIGIDLLPLALEEEGAWDATERFLSNVAERISSKNLSFVTIARLRKELSREQERRHPSHRTAA